MRGEARDERSRGAGRGRAGVKRAWLQAWVRCPLTFCCAPIRNVEVRQGSVLEVKSRASALLLRHLRGEEKHNSQATVFRMVAPRADCWPKQLDGAIIFANVHG